MTIVGKGGRDTVRRSALVIPVLVAAAVGLAGCSDKTAGNALPGDETTTATSDRPTLPGGTSEPGGETSPTEPGSGGSPLADVQPCDLVSDDGAARLELTDEREDEIAEVRSCIWRHEGASISDSFTVSVDILENRSLDDVPAPDVKPVPTIGSHDAVTFTGTTGGCTVSIGVGDSSRVDVSAVGGEGPKCGQLAMALAELVEPELP